MWSVCPQIKVAECLEFLDTGQSHYSRVNHVSLRLLFYKYVQQTRGNWKRYGSEQNWFAGRGSQPMGKMAMRDVHTVTLTLL